MQFPPPLSELTGSVRRDSDLLAVAVGSDRSTAGLRLEQREIVGAPVQVVGIDRIGMAGLRLAQVSCQVLPPFKSELTGSVRRDCDAVTRFIRLPALVCQN